jgi:predicted amidohydrolase YtcJ
MTESSIRFNTGLRLAQLLSVLGMTTMVTACTSTAARPTADLIVTDARVWTVDDSRPTAEAVAVIGDRIVAVGTSRDIDQWRGAQTRVIHAGGRSLLPGFNDAHVHYISGGMQLDNVDLRTASGPEEFARRIGERAKAFPGEWILGGDWDEQAWPAPALPARELIDPVTADTPVFVNRYDGHMALANSAALKLAGVTAKTPDPPGGVIVRDAKRNPTGLLKDAAMSYVNKIIPLPSPERHLRAAKRAMDHAASLGVTSVQDMNPSYADIRLYMELAERRELTTRIYAVPMETDWKDQAKIGIRHAFGSSSLRLGALKGYADGSLGSTTAYFFEPYTDDPSTRGLLADEMQPLEAMRDRLMQGDRAGLQLCIHAIGDQAISIVLDLFEEIRRANGPVDRRFRIEHAQHLAPKDFDRFAQLNVIASVQPYHAIDDGRWAEKRIGPERAKTTYAFRTFLNRKVHMAFGSDWPVAPLNPIMGLYAATTRATLDGKNPNGWVPEQKIGLQEAIAAFTAGAAYAEFQEQEKGSISPGKLADLVILSTDIFSVEPAALPGIRADTTILGGKVIYQRAGR